MKTVITFIAVVLFNTALLAQNDTLNKVSATVTEIYDVVVVYKEHTDGRGRTRRFTSEMKGEILNYDETTGLLTFKSKDGKMYSFKSGDYEYFEYDKEFTTKNKTFVLHTRKESEFEVFAGFRASYINFNDNFSADDYYLNSNGGSTDLPISIFLGAGKYFNRTHFLGVGAEIAVTSYGKNYFSGGLRYLYQYDAYKRNVAFYLPLEINYFYSGYDQSFQVNDTVIDTSQGGTIIYYPSDKNVEYGLSALSFSLGHGFSFILNNKHAISLELALIKYFPFNPAFKDSLEQTPAIRMTGSGFRFSLIYNL